MNRTRKTVYDLQQLKGKRQLTMICVDSVDVAVAAEISRRSSLLMLSMGAGAGGDAQYLFAEDLLGYTRGQRPRHARVYRDFHAEYERLQRERIAAFGEFAGDVETGVYPGPEHNLPIADAEFDRFIDQLNAETAP